MSKKTTSAYVDILLFLRENNIYFDEIVLDYEQAQRNALQIVYPGCKLSGCHFHMAQVFFNVMVIKCKLTSFFNFSVPLEKYAAESWFQRSSPSPKNECHCIASRVIDYSDF
jgi:hypothetical protein